MSLMQRGSNPGPTLNLSLDHRILAAEKEQKAYAARVTKAVGEDMPDAGVVDLPDADTKLIWKNDQADVKRDYWINFNFSLNEACKDPNCTTWRVGTEDAWSFQKNKTSDPTAPDHDKVRVGDLEHAVIRKASIQECKSNLPFDVALQISGIKGRVYAPGGMRAPYFISFNQDRQVATTIHKIAPAHAELLKRRHTRVSEAYLDSQWTAAPSGDRVFVKVKSDFTDCMRINSDKLRVNFRNIPVFGSTEYIISHRLLDALRSCLLRNRGTVELPYVDLFKLSAKLQHADGRDWSSTDMVQDTHDETGLVGTELLNKRYTVSLRLRLEYTIAAGPGWNAETVTEGTPVYRQTPRN